MGFFISDVLLFFKEILVLNDVIVDGELEDESEDDDVGGVFIIYVFFIEED